MYRATTPTHIFTLPFDTDQLKTIRITYRQFGETVLQKNETQCVFTDKAIKVELTQEETLRFQPTAEVFIQLRVMTTDGKVMASEIMQKLPKECLDEEVLV